MGKSPCVGCKKTECEAMCTNWVEWWKTAWDNTRFALGAKPRREEDEELPRREAKLIYELRDETGEIAIRGSAEECAEFVGVLEARVRRNAREGKLLKRRFRATALWVADDGKEE